jgi:hypothetical protein
MGYDYYGRWIPDNPNFWDQRNRQNTPPPGFSSYGRQPDPNAFNAYAQQPAGLSVTPKMYHADIVPIRSEADVINDIVPPTGEARMYMSEDDRLVATKKIGPNGVEIHFYDQRPDASAAPQLDPQNLVLRSEIDGIVSRIVNQVIDERIAQTAAPQPAAYAPPEPAVTRGAKTAGGKTV